MNTIKFSKIKEKTTEQHNLEILDIKKVELFGKECEMYFPCNLNIFVTNKCQNKCAFCINKDYSNIDISDEKYYSTNRILYNNIISSLALRTGVLTKDFTTEIKRYD